MAKLCKVFGDKLWKSAERKETAIQDIIAMPKSATIDKHMQDQYLCADSDKADRANVVFKDTCLCRQRQNI